MAKSKFYVVWNGYQTGIFTSWKECEAQIKGYKGAQYKSFKTRAEAEAAFHGEYEAHIGQKSAAGSIPDAAKSAYCVDAACSGNPGDLEYRCVHIGTGEVVFSEGPFEEGTNNVGEFLALAQALRLFAEEGISAPIYSDSRTAIAWVRNKRCNTSLKRTDANWDLFALIERAEEWLKTNQVKNQILKWDTKAWGEIPADYGRK